MKDSYVHLRKISFTDVSEKENLTVHLVIGADNLWQLKKEDTIRGEKDQPVAIETSLGWTLSGPISQEGGATSQSASVNVTITSQPDRVEQRLHQLWDFESLGIQEENEVQDELNEGIEFRNGRYAVYLPWKEPKSALPDNYSLSLSRLKGQIKRLKKDEAIAKQYDAVIREQLCEGVVERVADQKEIKEGNHHLPHHPVIRESAETTKLRVVFDASSKTKIKEEDRNSLRFLWVKDILAAEPEIEVFQFCRVIFGAGPSPFLLNATLRHHLDKYRYDDPEFVEKMKASLYIDDLVSGSSTLKEAFAMFIKAKSRLQDAGFHMHKWKTNHPELREAIKREVEVQENSDPERETTYAKESLGHKESESKVLGVKWDIDKDVLKFEFKEILDKAEQLEPTKRNILSVIASVFDPLGLISPVIVPAKILLQDICKSKISWDERPSEEILRKWLEWVQNLKQVEEIIFRRCVYPSLTEEVDKVTHHGFGDASGKAYCAAVYMVCKHGATTSAQLLT
eukprot:Seg1067.15 transcript_id=Seg1067.15/GoldUCD/mRNA.D3Y31 product="hypothetical protein" protein_id=Seg1067.15/GoldUCD/D3Y31